jgi:hypothetical protein
MPVLRKAPNVVCYFIKTNLLLMTLWTDSDYLDTKLVKKGVKRLDPIFEELANWIYQNFDTPVLNIYYDKIAIRKNLPRLNIIFEYAQIANKFRDQIGNFDKEKQKLIADKFRKILKSKSTRSQRLLGIIFKKAHTALFDTHKLLVIFTEFECLARQEANNKISKIEIDNLKKELVSKNVWEIYQELTTSTYFFYTDKQIEDYNTDGTTQIMKQQYFDILKQYDEFDYIKPDTFFLNFDSKENFDKTFESNWFKYFKR